MPEMEWRKRSEMQAHGFSICEGETPVHGRVRQSGTWKTVILKIFNNMGVALIPILHTPTGISTPSDNN